ncbi:hypothetical protein Franean1_0399 [Parafrankia sp. EAN1pec]|uniref:hypothetical protein n=1 Tax=Parafrankia sp. (strain EAN1pec) TaxID=298653 RepID=UPI0000541693|nr:hypothetical protein Franean1_0399 [Frankia sp. EAN1pec]
MPHLASPNGDLTPGMREALSRMREIRRRFGPAYAAMEKRSGVSHSNWHRWLHGKGVMPLERVSEAKGMLMGCLEREMKKHSGDEDVLRTLRELKESLEEVTALWIRDQGSTTAQMVANEMVTNEQPEPDVQIENILPEHGQMFSSDWMTDMAEELAAAVERQWIWEADRRGLIRPPAIPVRWRWAQGMTSKLDVVLNNSHRRTLFPPLPGVASATSASLQSGGLQQLFDAYAGVDSGRLVIMGKYGSGKSATAILMLLDALSHRDSLDDVQRAKVPVPIFLTTHDWDPRHQNLPEWLITRLAKEYQFLRSTQDGRSAAARLVEDGRVALFLDGFDEIPSELHRDALEEIRRLATFRLVTLTRDGEFAAAVRTGHHVDAAAVVELLPIPADEIASYLETRQTDPMPPQWEKLVTFLRENPDHILAQALDSPLVLTQLRDAIQDPADIDDLLVADRFESREAVAEYLMDRSIDVAYRRFSRDTSTVGPDKARAALGYIAAKMNEENTRDLAWWQIHHWASPIPRILATTVLGVLIGAPVGALMFGPLGQYAVRGHTGTLFGAQYLSMMCLVFGLMAGLVSEARGGRSRRTGRFRWVDWYRGQTNSAVGLLFTVAVTMAVGNQSNYAFGALAGVLAGIVAGYAARGDHQDHRWIQRSWWITLRSRLDPVAGAVAGLPIGLTYGLTKEHTQGLVAGIMSAIAFGLMVGFARPTAGIQAVTDPRTSWLRNHEHAATFSLAAGLALGLPLGLKNGLEHGVIAGAVAGVCVGLIVGLGCLIGASDRLRTTLLFLQLRGHGIPLDGMRFLEDARRKNLLRTVGPLYQFRHPSIQDRLARTYGQQQTRVDPEI